MTALLDTHAVLYFNLRSPRLGTQARSLMEDTGSLLFLSPASYWEIAIKISRKKFTLAGSYEAFWSSALSDLDAAVLPIDLRHTARLIDLPFHHKDPFDRLLVAQALTENIPLVSDDEQLDAYGIERIW